MKLKLASNAILAMWGLVAAIIAVLGLTAAGFYYAAGYLRTLSVEADHAKIDAEISADEINRLKKLQSFMNSNRLLIARAENVTATGSNNTYQNKLVNDINTMASAAGVTIMGYSIDAPSSKTLSDSTNNKSAVPEGVEAVRIRLTLSDSVNFTSFLRFLRAIEQNLTRMQVTEVVLSPKDESPVFISEPSLTLQAYVQKGITQ